jgi:hypothetical protein
MTQSVFVPSRGEKEPVFIDLEMGNPLGQLAWKISKPFRDDSEVHGLLEYSRLLSENNATLLKGENAFDEFMSAGNKVMALVAICWARGRVLDVHADNRVLDKLVLEAFQMSNLGHAIAEMPNAALILAELNKN